MAKVKTEKRKPFTLAYIEHYGPYDKVPWEEYLERLYGFAKANKAMPGFYPMAFYMNCPDETLPKNLLTHVGISVKGKPKESDDVKLRRVPAMTVATISHKGPGSDYPKTYAQLNRWIEEKGYRWAGPAIEIYSKKPEKVKGKTILFAKVMAPVKKR